MTTEPGHAGGRGTVTVTGATGFVGRCLVPHLAAEGWQVRALARRPELLTALVDAANGAVSAVASPDFGAPQSWTSRDLAALSGSDAIVHLAGIAHADPKTPETAYETQARASARMAELARDAGQHVVLVSSVRAQSGPVADHILTEDLPPEPADAYGRWKLEAERSVHAIEPQSVVLRPVLVYGPGVKGNMAALMRLARLPVPLPFGGFDARRSLLSVTNLCAAISFALTAPSALGETFLVADAGPAPTVADIVSDLRRAMGRRPNLVSLPPTLLGRMAAMAGRGDAIDRLNGALQVDTSKLAAAGFTAPEARLEGFRRMMTTERS